MQEKAKYAYPIRFGIGDLLMTIVIGNLQGLLLVGLIPASSLINESKNGKVAGCVAYGLFLAGMAAWLAFRFATEAEVRSWWARFSLFLLIDVSVVLLCPAPFVGAFLLSWLQTRDQKGRKKE